jgi:hypothetical protein
MWTILASRNSWMLFRSSHHFELFPSKKSTMKMDVFSSIAMVRSVRLLVSFPIMSKWMKSKLKVRHVWNRNVWDTVVVPRLEINSYRKRLLAIQKIQNPATRAAVTARALVHLENKPLLQCMLLSQNEDISCYLSEALTKNDEASFAFRVR